MAFDIKHTTQSAVADAGVSGQIGPSEWNEAHTLTGLLVGPGGRLSLTAATPIADASGATTVYYVPFASRAVPVYNGTEFVYVDISTGLSQTLADDTKSPAAASTSKVYDMFVWNDSGTIRCTRGPAWPSSTSRGTGAGSSELTRTLGFPTNANAITNGPAANRGTWVGTIYTDASTQCNDNDTDRTVYNAYNKVSRRLYKAITQNSWSYNTATWRQIQGTTTYRFNFLRGGMGMDEPVSAIYHVYIQNTTSSLSGGAVPYIAWGDNSTSSPSAPTTTFGDLRPSLANNARQFHCHWAGSGGNSVGLNTVSPLEYGSGGSDTLTWYGDNGGTLIQSVINGWARA